VSEIALTSDSRFAFSASWDGTVRLWNVASGATISKLVGHSRDVLSVALSVDDRQIITGGLDRRIKIWNTRSECKHTVDKNEHTDAVSCVKFYHAAKPAICVTASWDKTIKVWDSMYMNLKHTFNGHKAQINTLDMVHNSSYLASGSRDGTVMVWDLVKGKFLTQGECDSPVNCVLFSQKLYWLIIGTEEGIKVLDLPSQTFLQDITEHSMKPNEQVFREGKDAQTHPKPPKPLGCVSLAWNKNGTHLFAGFTDNHIRVYKIEDTGVAKADAQ